MSPPIRWQLRIMLLLEYFALGATLPVMSVYLKDYLGFSGTQVGLVLSASASSALIFPLMGAFVADRIICKERLLALCHLLAGGAMGWLYFAESFPAVLTLYLLYNLAVGPTIALTNAIVLQRLPDARRHFGGIRLWGTIGWIAVAWLCGLWLHWMGSDSLGHVLWIGAGSSVAMSGFAMTLPRSPVSRGVRRQIIPAGALRVLLRKEVLAACALMLVAAGIYRFRAVGLGPYLLREGFPEDSLLPLMSIGQAAEIVALMFMGPLLARIGFRGLLALGVAVAGYQAMAFTVGGAAWLILSAVSAHGVIYAYLNIVATVYADGFCRPEDRAGVHQLMSLVNMGLAVMLGNLLAGGLMDAFASPAGQVDYRLFWLTSGAFPLLAGVLVALNFRREPPQTGDSTHPGPP